VIRINADLRRAIGTVSLNVTLGELSQHDFIIVRETEAMYNVISGMTNERAAAAVVVGNNSGGPDEVRGIITKDDIADAVAGSIEIYAG
jgi:CIC family chloride channel protein